MSATYLSPNVSIAYEDWTYLRIPQDMMSQDIYASAVNFFRKHDEHDYNDGPCEISPILKWICENCNGRFVRNSSALWFEDTTDAVIFRLGMGSIFTG